MIRSFGGQGTANIFHGKNSRAARKTCPQSLHKVAHRKLDMIDSSASLEDLKVPPANRLEALKGDLRGFYSIRVNDQYRVVFRWSNGDASEVEIVDYH